jgi:hypothetical protein
VCQNVLDEDQPMRVLDFRDQPVLIAADVENSVVRIDEVGVWICPAHIQEGCPPGFLSHFVPRPK